MPESGTFVSDAIRLHYLDWGGQGPPLVLVHATSLLAHLWSPVAEALTDRFRVVAFDQRGHGDSDKPRDGYDFEALAQDLEAFIECLDLRQPLAVGHSSGGTTIALHAAEYPGVIQRAVLVEPIIPQADWPGPGQQNPMAERARKRRDSWSSRSEMLDSFRSRPPFHTWREDVLRLYVEGGTHLRNGGRADLKCPPDIEARFYEMTTSLRPERFLSRIACPLLLVWGAETHFPEAYVRSVNAAVPAAHRRTVAGAGHFLPMEKPEALVGVIREFFSD